MHFRKMHLKIGVPINLPIKAITIELLSSIEIELIFE